MSRDDLLDLAWWLIADVSGGEWSQQSPEWQEAAMRWRHAWNAMKHKDGPADPIVSARER